MIIKPRIRGFICVTAHPTGCEANVQEQIRVVRNRGPITNGPKRALVIGASMGYGLASRIACGFGSNAATVGVFFDRPASNGKTATAGWYNSVAFERAAHDKGLYARSIVGDAFSDELKADVVKLIKQDLGTIDTFVYSLASPRRIHPRTGVIAKNFVKTIGDPFCSKALDTDKGKVTESRVEPATEEELQQTIAVMGGEDLEFWIQALETGGVLDPDATVLTYSYIGPEVTWPIYKNGTIGQAKEHLVRTTLSINDRLKRSGGRALVSVNKAEVTQSSSAIPVVPLYNSLLFRVMKEKGIHEGCIEQIDRLFRTKLYADTEVPVDEMGRIRIDDLEMRPDVQEEIVRRWPLVNSENLYTISDFGTYKAEFLKLFGFGLDGVDYEAEVDPEVNFDE